MVGFDLDNDKSKPVFVLAWVTKKGQPITKMGDGAVYYL
mgnify:CR=1 FL=1